MKCLTKKGSTQAAGNESMGDLLHKDMSWKNIKSIFSYNLTGPNLAPQEPHKRTKDEIRYECEIAAKEAKIQQIDEIIHNSLGAENFQSVKACSDIKTQISGDVKKLKAKVEEIRHQAISAVSGRKS